MDSTYKKVSDIFVKAWPEEGWRGKVTRLYRSIKHLGPIDGIRYWGLQTRARRRPQDVLVWIGNLEQNAACLRESTDAADVALAEATHKFAQELREYFIRAAGARKGWRDLLTAARNDYNRGARKSSDAVCVVLHAMQLEIKARGLDGDMTPQELHEFKAVWVNKVFKTNE